MADLSDVYRTMGSLEWKMDRARERTRRIGAIVTVEQHAATGMVPAESRRGRLYRERRKCWETLLQWYGWPDGHAR